ncbi:hypothetical protein B0A49_02240 [Cryomyces minteri]|uniref:Pre-mRNA-splicing factor CWC24 n=1 Tax=Cryomyces minteri TaxID=331657 RepID=A0A4U0XQ34_9PEZI|nr:hypothetical protein B0A49_02240 [Cryomyces minteri]
MAETTAAASEGLTVPLFKKRNNKAKTTLRKRAATPPSGSDSDSEYSSYDDGERKVKRRRKTGIITATSAAQRTSTEGLEATKFAADRSATIEVTSDATKHSNWYDDNAKDALSAQNLLGNTRARPNYDEPAESNGAYKGTAKYTSFIRKNPDAASKQVGPIKAPTNIRTITVTDFAPDVCKDYKQTGFCGFGDNCKFLHAREDYKQGWQLDKEWENVTKGKKVSGQTVASANRAANMGEDDINEKEEKMLENIPFACIICKQPYKSPVVTKCGHYFCESCALKRYKSGKRDEKGCAACGSDTHGVFNVAKNLKKLLEKKKERAEKRKEKAREEGLGVSEDEE